MLRRVRTTPALHWGRAPALQNVFCQPADGIRDIGVTGVQTCALPISDLDRRPPPLNPTPGSPRTISFAPRAAGESEVFGFKQIQEPLFRAARPSYAKTSRTTTPKGASAICG